MIGEDLTELVDTKETYVAEMTDVTHVTDIYHTGLLYFVINLTGLNIKQAVIGQKK